MTGFLIGGLSWFPIPFGFATTLGLAAVALGAQVSSAEVSAGLIAPKAASILLGQAGAACVLVILFLAVTSAASAGTYRSTPLENLIESLEIITFNRTRSGVEHRCVRCV